MTRDEAAEALERLASDLEGDVERAQSRDLHMALSRRVHDARALLAALRAA